MSSEFKGKRQHGSHNRFKVGSGGDSFMVEPSSLSYSWDTRSKAT